MRLQKYVKPFEYDARGFLYDQINSVLYEVPYSVYFLITHHKFDELQKKFIDIYSFLTSKVVIVVDNFNDLQYLNSVIKQHNQPMPSQVSLTIAPTLNCNFRCLYCYEEKTARQVLFMSKETADNVIKFIRHQLQGPNASVSISWYGGEPLLAMNTIYYISQEIKKVIGNRLYSEVTTNGFLLTEKVAKMLQECNVGHAQITIDGLKETHDKRRPFIGKGISSFDTIVKNIQQNAKYFERINLRINVDKQNKDEIPELVDYLRSIFPSNVNYYFARTRFESPGTSFSRSYYFTEKEYADFMIKHPSYNVLLNPGYSCGATNPSSHVIDPNGNLFRCWNEVGQKERSVGDVVNGITNWDRYTRWMNFGTDMLSNKCKQCSIVGLCVGGLCPFNVVFPNEGFDKQLCIPAKYYLDDLILRRVLLNENITKVGLGNNQQSNQQNKR